MNVSISETILLDIISARDETLEDTGTGQRAVVGGLVRRRMLGANRALEEMGFKELFPIQSRAIQPLLEGRDVIGQAHSGTGKTAAYSLPMLEKVDTRIAEIQGLVLVPTRELAVQVAEEIKKRYSDQGDRITPAFYSGEEGLASRVISALRD